MNKNKTIGLLIICAGLLIGAIFLIWIIILPAVGVTDIASTSFFSGYWGIAVFTILEVAVVVILLIWIGSTPLRTKNKIEKTE